MNCYNYYVNEHDGCLYLFIGDNTLISTVSDCLNRSKADLDLLADDILIEHGYINPNEKYFQE